MRPITKPVWGSAHDFRRAFGERWADIVTPMLLKELMRHASVTTTEQFYVGKNARRTMDAVRIHKAAFDQGREVLKGASLGAPEVNSGSGEPR